MSNGDKSDFAVSPLTSDYTFTVFTSTYQRAHTLHRAFASLEAQTYRNFEWLVIDDGSTDDTHALVRAWQDQARFPIRYVFQPNSGKHVAYNRGVLMARGRFFINLDSDDACVPEALERFRFWWDSIPSADQPNLVGVSVLCRDQSGKIVGTEFPKSPLDSDSIELRLRYRVKGENWGMKRTSVLREFPFPEPKGVKHVAESLIWRAIAQEYKTRYVNETLRTYWQDPGSGSDALSAISEKVLRGRSLSHLQTLNDLSGWFWVNPMAFFAAAANLSRYGLQRRLGPLAILREVQGGKSKALVIAFLPLGVAYAIRDAVNRRRKKAVND